MRKIDRAASSLSHTTASLQGPAYQDSRHQQAWLGSISGSLLVGSLFLATSISGGHYPDTNIYFWRDLLPIGKDLLPIPENRSGGLYLARSVA
jgi:hypothetical protein